MKQIANPACSSRMSVDLKQTTQRYIPWSPVSEPHPILLSLPLDRFSYTYQIKITQMDFIYKIINKNINKRGPSRTPDSKANREEVSLIG
jgi:hypothetical protein